jgi:C2H2 transcription facotor
MSFQAVNTAVAMASSPSNSAADVAMNPEEATPTTPRPPHGFPDMAKTTHAESEDISLITPTRDSFAAASSTPQPPAGSGDDLDLADSAYSLKEESIQPEASSPSRTNEGSSPDAQDHDDKIDGDAGRPTKKKKGQRFFCTGFLPCNLSFTRSEHLARHIRYVGTLFWLHC